MPLRLKIKDYYYWLLNFERITNNYIIVTNVALRKNNKRKLAQDVARPTFGWIMSKLPER